MYMHATVIQSVFGMVMMIHFCCCFIISLDVCVLMWKRPEENRQRKSSTYWPFLGAPSNTFIPVSSNMPESHAHVSVVRARARILSLTLTIIKRRWARERKWKLVYVLEYVTLSLLLLAFKLSSFSDATCVLAGRWFFSSFLSSENKSNRTEGKKARVQTRTHTHKLKRYKHVKMPAKVNYKSV